MVFECKNKYDYINYAVKRITLPSTDENGNKVKGPVKLHAILDHRNVVKYYSTWEERPPAGGEGRLVRGHGPRLPRPRLRGAVRD